MKTIASYDVQALNSLAWFNMTGNAYHANEVNTYAVTIKQTVHGKFFVEVAYSKNHKGTHSLNAGFRSNPVETEVEARALANKVWLHYRDNFITDFGVRGLAQKAQDRVEGIRYSSDRKGGWAEGTVVPDSGNFKEDGESLSLCPKCESFGTLTTHMLPYGNDTRCSNCSYNSYFSIGD